MSSKNTILCIPRIRKEEKKIDILVKLKLLKLGYIIKLIESPHKNDKNYKRLIIVMQFNNDKGKEVEAYLKEGNSLKIVYDDPWYWKLVEYRKDYKIE
tara:strand:- start:257 stop:550 length:294 start_codon:yes stop_codon:yes gene_type:complete